MKYISEKTKKNIGLTWIMNKLSPLCPLGRKAKSRLKPFGKDKADDLENELNRVFYIREKMKKDPQTGEEIQKILSDIKDITGSIKRTKKGGILDEVEFFEIKSFLLSNRKLKDLIDDFDLDIKLHKTNELLDILDPKKTGRKSFYIEDDFSHRLKMIRKRKRKFKKQLNCEKEKNKTKVEEIFNIDINPKNEIIINKGDEIITKLNKSPLVRYVRESFSSIVFTPAPTEKQNNLEHKLKKLNEMEKDEEFKIRKTLTNHIKNFSDRLLENALNIGRLDLVFAKARLATELGCVKPKVVNNNKIVIKKGRHPIVEQSLAEKKLDFKPIDISLTESASVITGLNMGGKTVTLKLVGLLTAMAQMGLFVPAKEMSFSPRKFIFYSGSHTESLEDGLSAFGAEIKAINEVLKFSDQDGLILIDELARGTNPLEGRAIAKAVVKKLSKSKSISVVTTHFYEVSTVSNVAHLQVRGLKNVQTEEIKKQIKEKKVLGQFILNKIIDYSLERVRPDTEPPHDAIKVAKMMGFDKQVLETAERIIKNKGEE